MVEPTQKQILTPGGNSSGAAGSENMIYRRKTELLSLMEFRIEQGEVVSPEAIQAFNIVAADILVNWPKLKRPDGRSYLVDLKKGPVRFDTVDCFRELFWSTETADIEFALRQRREAKTWLSQADSGRMVRLVPVEAKELGIGTMYPVGETKKERLERRKARKRELDRNRQAEKRLAKGATPRHTKLSQERPWEQLGIKRRAWYYRRAKQQEKFCTVRRALLRENTVGDELCNADFAERQAIGTFEKGKKL